MTTDIICHVDQVDYLFEDCCARNLKQFWKEAGEDEIGGFMYERDNLLESAYMEFDEDGTGRNTTTTFRSFNPYIFHTHPATPFIVNPAPTPKDFVHFMTWGGVANEMNPS